MPTASIIVPAYNVASTIAETMQSLLLQSFKDFEIIVVNDGSTDNTLDIVKPFLSDPRVRVVTQANRGLAGARNTGISEAAGQYIGFCDADDLWLASKLGTHIQHLKSLPDVGVSYSGSELIDDHGRSLGTFQRPKLHGITPANVFNRNPIGNGSAAVFRKSTLLDIAYRPNFETKRDWVFDETFRQSEDIECWMRIALQTDWVLEGVPGMLTRYRVSPNGLSAALDRQLASWERMVAKLKRQHPDFFAEHEACARAYQLRYLARRAISSLDIQNAWQLAKQSVFQSQRPLIKEPVKSSVTLVAAGVMRVLGPKPIQYVSHLMAR